MTAKDIQNLAIRIKDGDFCEKHCYGCCCDDGEIDFDCPIILKHLEKYLSATK